MTKQRKKWIAELTEAGIKVTTKFDTPRLRRLYFKMKKDQRKAFDKTPNPFAMSNTEKNRAKRRRQKLS